MAQVLVLSEHDVVRLLTMEACIAVMTDALAALARGEVFNPLRKAHRAPGAPGLLGLMPAYRGGERPFYALKEVCVFPGNPARGLDSHLGGVLLHDGATGELLAIANAAAITAIRTAAVSAVATRLLALPDASRLAVIGAGVQARTHIEAVAQVRTLTELRIHSRTRAKAEELGAWAATQLPDGCTISVHDSVETAVRGADIVVTVTSSSEPILRREWLSAGTHVNAVGSSIAAARELDAATVAESAFFVDRRESTLNESGDYLGAVREAGIDASHIRAELGELIVGSATGRTSATELTVFKSLGLAVEDLAATAFVYDEARRTGSGVKVPW